MIMIQTSPLLLAGIGIAAGVLSGFFGIGGGIIMVPALMYLAGFPQLAANGTSLAVLVVPVGLAAVFQYYKAGNVDIKAAIIIAVCLFITAGITAHFAQKINVVYLRMAFGILIIIVGGYVVVTSAAR
jgi:uncharacterized protein